MDPVVDTLLTSFRRVPAAAVPAILDCILTSTGSSPSSLFSSLLNEFPNLSKEIEQGDGKLESEQRDSMVSYICALCHLLKKSGANVFTMHLFTWKIWIPLLQLVHSYDYELFNEAARLFFDVVIKGDSWEVVEATIVPFLLRLVGLSLGMQESGEFSIYKWTSYTTFGDSDDLDNNSILSQCDYFPLSVSCNILAMALDSALQINHLEGSTSGMVLTNECSSKIFAGNLLWDLSNITFQMLSESSEHRTSAIRFFLPSIFRALDSKCAFEALVCGQKCVLSRRHLSVKIWKSCRMLFSLGPVEKRDAYAVLSLYLSFFSFLDGCEDGHGAGDEKPFDLRSEEDFWDEIRRGLVDKESLVRKQSLHILRAAVNLNKKNQSDSSVSDTTPGGRSSVPHGMTKRGLWADKEAKSLGVGRICSFSDLHSNSQQKWEAFLLLYEMLEEYGTHLVEAAWNHQISLLLHSSLQSDRLTNSDMFELYCIQMETSEQIFGWLSVLWERGFGHDNPQVRCLIMQSFLGIEWKNYGDYAKLVPEGFVHGPFIQGLNDPVHHKDFGVKGVYSSWTIEAASKFSFQYASCLARRKQSSFLIDLASVAKKQSFGRAGLMCLVQCIASAAHGFKRPTTNEFQQRDDSVDVIQVEDAQEKSSHSYEVELLEILKYIIESSKQHFNPNYRHQVFNKILGAAASVMTALDMPLEILLYFISSLPREYTDHGGSLRLKLQEWLLVSNERPCISSFCSSNLHLLKLLNGFPRSFVGLHHSKDTTITYDDEDLDAWEFEANRWTRTLFLVIKEELDVEPILKFIQDYGLHICKQNTHMEWVPVKYLILASRLVHELEIIQERTIGSPMKGRAIKDVDFPDTAGHTIFTRYSIIYENFAKSFFYILEELVSFARLSCSIFWSTTVTENGTLPGSIRGRLGGPSQRRLSSLTTTLILQAITSAKAVASISSWCMRFRINVSLDSAFTFLWNFCWKSIKSPTCQSETEAEISLAAYESLAYVLKSLVTTFCPLSLELLMRNGNSSPVEEDPKPVLDTFLTTFLENINNLIAVGNFARTRRAILMNWKWICLESLLSIPNYALRNGVHTNSCNFFFSDVALRYIFGDLVDSLENAGEVSVLPMLRSVRLILELFASGQMGSLVSSCDGVNTQMMWHLVHSSWVLHVSCNKRRVAPIAALLSSVLHNSVFSNESMHEFNNAPGPLKWFVEKILEEGTRSPRTIRLAALHLAGLWLANPSIVKYYVNEIKLLTLYGSVAFDEDFEAELAENQDAKVEVSVLAKSPDLELTEEFLNTELYARVSVAVLFYKLGKMDDMMGSTNDNNSSTAAIAAGKMFLLELLNSVINDKDLSKDLYKKHSAIHRRKIRVWQMICILSRFTDQDIVEKVTCNLHISLQRNNLPSVRQYLETFAIHIYLKFSSLVGQELVPLLRNYDMRPQALSSYVFIAANVILHSTEAFQPRHLAELLPPIVPLLTSHHHTLRGFTQLLVYQVLHKLLPVSGSSASVTMSLEKRCFEDLKCYLADNPDCARLRASMEGYLDAFDPKTSITPSGIFSNRVEELEFECVATSLMERVINFLNDTREDLRCSMAKDAVTIKNESLHANEDLMSKRELVYSSEEPKSVQMTQDISLDFQKKITFSRHDMQGTTSATMDNGESFKSLMDIETEGQLFYELLHSRCVAVEKLKASRQDFILVASLLDRIPNLAGLARTCEVFRAAGLAISDKSILNDKQFQLISVTAEKWVPTFEVPIGSMKIFLERKKQEGFAILGLEQTANSISLDQYVFPKKTVLVLGREKEGIPVEIIHILDACVEIPQLGVVRSLNVHVSGAIALWEYTRQQRSQ